MLVKLGTVWVDPTKVEAINPCEKKDISILQIVTESRIYEVPVSEINKIDTFAAIINNTSQSFGGNDEAPEEE